MSIKQKESKVVMRWIGTVSKVISQDFFFFKHLGRF